MTEVSGDGRLTTGEVEVRDDGSVVIHAPAATGVLAARIPSVTGSVVGDVAITAQRVVEAGGRKVTLPAAVSLLVLTDLVNTLVTAAQDPSRKAEATLAASLLIAIVLVVLGAAPRD